MSTEELLKLIAQTIFDKGGSNIYGINVKEISTLTEYLLIAEGNVDRHVIALAKAIIQEASKNNEPPLITEGLQDGDWVVVDFGEIVVHIFLSEVRQKYSLEELWEKGNIVHLDIKLPERKATT